MEHGGDLTAAVAAYGGAPGDWLDLSTGINPHPWPIPAALREVGWTRLPSRADVAALVAAARRAYRVPDGLAVVPAPGTQAIVQWLPRLAPPARVTILGPTYSEHARSWRLAGREVIEVGTLPEAVAAYGHLVLTNPNNPDGRIVPVHDLLANARRLDGWLVVDESFADVAPEASFVQHLRDEPAIILRSFGKFYGLAGVRLGFAIARPDLADEVVAALGPWAVSGPALAVGAAALVDEDWAAGMRSRLAAEADALDSVLVGAGLAIVGGTSLYRLSRTADAERVHRRLAEARIWTRRFSDRPDLLRFGLPPSPADLERLCVALAATS